MPDHSSSRTTEHWFLDLDGVRSGPYQTPEVLSLVAEGEVLPHHRISTGLKDQPWITVLDWRLEQAKKANAEPEVKEVRSYIPASPKPTPEPEPKIEIAEPEEKIAPVHVEPEVKPTIETPVAPPALTIEPPRAPPQPAREAPASKRDPMAEMFDVLQTSKQKREAKSQQIAQQHSHTPIVENESKKTSGWIKTAGIGLLITVIGFALGQIFQQSNPPPAPTAEKPAASSTPSAQSGIIDRSTDKITIRSRVETVQKPSATPLPTRAPQISRPGSAAAAPSVAHTEKELQELKDLKKELQELKALKDELRQSGHDTEMAPDEAPENVEEFNTTGVGNTEVDPGYNYYPAMPNTSGGAVYPNNGYPQPNYPNPGQNGQQPSPGANPNIHY